MTAKVYGKRKKNYQKQSTKSLKAFFAREIPKNEKKNDTHTNIHERRALTFDVIRPEICMYVYKGKL